MLALSLLLACQPVPPLQQSPSAQGQAPQAQPPHLAPDTPKTLAKPVWQPPIQAQISSEKPGFSRLKLSWDGPFQIQAEANTAAIAFYKVSVTGPGIAQALLPANANANQLVPGTANSLSVSVDNIPEGNPRFVTVEGFDANQVAIPGTTLKAVFNAPQTNTLVLDPVSTLVAKVLEKWVQDDQTSLAQSVDRTALMNFFRQLLGTSGTAPALTFFLNPARVGSDQITVIADDLRTANGNVSSLNVSNSGYLSETQTHYVNISGLVGNDLAQIKLGDPSSLILTGVGNGRHAIYQATTGTWTLEVSASGYTPFSQELNINVETPMTEAGMVPTTEHSITSVSGTQFSAGSAITINGSGFRSNPLENQIFLVNGGVKIPVATLSASATQLQFRLPTGLSSNIHQVEVKIGGVSKTSPTNLSIRDFLGSFSRPKQPATNVYRGPGGGQISALAQFQGNANQAYAVVGSAGRIYRTSDGGQNWEDVSSNLPPSTILKSIAVHPTDFNTVYLGGSAGLYKTTNGGVNGWNILNAGLGGGPGSDIRSLSIAQSSPNTVIAGTGNGIYKTTDGASNWTATGTVSTTDILSVAIDPGNEQIMYAGTQGGDKLYRSSNGGASWGLFNTGLAAANEVRQIGVAPSNPSILYAATNIGLFKLNTNLPWNDLSVFMAGTGPDDVKATAVDQDDANIVYASALNGSSTVLYRSSDGGTNWVANSSLINAPALQLSVGNTPPAGKSLMAGTRLGVYQTPINSFNTDVLTHKSQGLPHLSIHQMVNQGSTWFAATTVENCNSDCSGIFRSTDNGMTWTLSHSGMEGLGTLSVLIDPLNSNRIYAGTQNGTQRLFVSTDAGLNWSALDGGMTPGSSVYQLVKNSSNTLIYAGTSTGVYSRPSNAAGNWTATARTLPTPLLAAHPSDPNTLYAGGTDGFQRSTNAGLAWTSQHTGLDTQTNLKAFAQASQNPNILYLSSSDGDNMQHSLFKSVNGGESWFALAGVGQSTQAIYIDPSHPKAAVVYLAGADGRVRKTNTGGTSWSALNSGNTVFNNATTALGLNALMNGTGWGGFVMVMGLANGLAVSTDP